MMSENSSADAVAKNNLDINLSEGIEISFEELNPAFAALEDDSWLDEAPLVDESDEVINNKPESLDTNNEIKLEKLDPQSAFKKMDKDENGFSGDVITSTPNVVQSTWTENIDSPKANVAKSTINLSAPISSSVKVDASSENIQDIVNNIKASQALKDIETEKKNKPVSNIHISGNIELADGLAYIYGETNLYVGWHSGEKDTVGNVWIDKAEYQINIPHLKGEIVAQLINKKGEVMGEAIYDLSEISRSNFANKAQYSVDLTLMPVSENFEIEVESVYSFDEYRFPVEGAAVSLSFGSQVERTDAKGKVSFPEVKRNSQAIIHAEKKGYLKTVVAVDGEVDNAKITMFPNEYFAALAKTLGKDPTKMLAQGTVWGQIVSNGKPVPGVKVKTENGVPVYFRNYVANYDSVATGQDGTFLIPMLTEGLNFVSIDFNGKKYQAKPVPIIEGAISLVTFDINEKTIVRKVITAFDDKPAAGQIDSQIFGKDVTYTAKESKLTMSSSQSLSPTLVELIKDNKTKYNIFTSLKNKYDDIPVLPDSHLEQMIKGRELEAVVFGYLESEGVESILVNQGDTKFDLVYFDKNGSITQNRSLAKAFIIYGLDEGLHFLTINYSKIARKETLVLTDKATVSLIY